MKKKIKNYKVKDIVNNVEELSNEELSENIEFLTNSILKTQEKLTLLKSSAVMSMVVNLAGFVLIPTASTVEMKLMGLFMIGGGLAGYLLSNKKYKYHSGKLEALGYTTKFMMRELRDRTVENAKKEEEYLFFDILGKDNCEY